MNLDNISNSTEWEVILWKYPNADTKTEQCTQDEDCDSYLDTSYVCSHLDFKFKTEGFARATKICTHHNLCGYSLAEYGNHIENLSIACEPRTYTDWFTIWVSVGSVVGFLILAAISLCIWNHKRTQGSTKLGSETISESEH